MPTTDEINNGPKFPPEKLDKYPHFFPLDIPIWERFLDRHGDSFDGFDYDVKVGSGTKPIKGLGAKYVRMQEILSKYRIDAVGHRGDAIVIIEVKPEAGTVAIGQIELYTRLYERDFKPNLPVVGAIVTDRELPDIKEFTEDKGYEYYVL